MSKENKQKYAPALQREGAQIVPFEDRFAKDFYRLNHAWIDKYFELEPGDLELLNKPRERIINAGGHILFALANGDVLGTCALLRDNKLQFELAKMAVDESAQGLGLGLLLANAAIQTARDHGAAQIVLQTNAKLHPAIALYHKVGFVDVAAENPHFSRCDVAMKLELY